MSGKCFHIHGDNIVECVRAFDYILSGLSDNVAEVRGPFDSITCPIYTVILDEAELTFQFFPGYGERRWNQDILSFIKHSGGRLREAADAIITVIKENKEVPIAAIEFCGALPAGNQAWQRQGRAFSFAHAKVPYFYVAELGGFELNIDRKRKAQRMPNPAIPFSFVSMTEQQGAVCLPVYEANPGATVHTIEHYSPIFGKMEFLEFLKLAVLGNATEAVSDALGDKCVRLVKLLADSRKRPDGLTGAQWQEAYDALQDGRSLPDYLVAAPPISWSKTAYISSLTDSAKKFMALGASDSIGLTSSSLPLSLISCEKRKVFADKTRRIYSDMDNAFYDWLIDGNKHLAISWVMGFKPGHDDARPDRGLSPLARMLVGDSCDLMTFVYGPAPKPHWYELASNPVALATRNGLWESILAVSDAVLVDSSTKPSETPRGYKKDSWMTVLQEQDIDLKVNPIVQRHGEQDVDTALHVAFESLGQKIIFEGMCNPPGGDWSGISFRWFYDGPEHRWLTLPRVSEDGAKRPDHVFAIFGHGKHAVCLCVESKEHARSLDKDIGPRLTRYVERLFEITPSIHRANKAAQWDIYKNPWQRENLSFLSAGAYLCKDNEPFNGLPDNHGLDVQISVEFLDDGKRCILHLRGDTPEGEELVRYLEGQTDWNDFVAVRISS